MLFCGYANAATYNTYNGGYTATRTIYNPINNTQTTVRVNQTTFPRTNNTLNSTSISTRAHNISPSVKFTNVPPPGYSNNVYMPPVHVYNSGIPRYGVVVNNSNGNITRYPVNNIPYYGNGYYVNTVQVPVVTKTTTTTTGNGTVTCTEDYAPFGNSHVYTNSSRFLSW